MGKRRKLPPTITGAKSEKDIQGQQSRLGVQDSSDSDSSSTSGTNNKSRSGFFTSTKSKSKKNEKNTPTSAAAPNPTEFITGGVRIKFPFTPYKSQQDMMSKIVEALQKQENALLESPTGSGKSLALLCGALAWLEAEKENRRAQRKANYETKVREIMKEEVTESPYFADISFDEYPTNTKALPNGTALNTNSLCGTGCGSSSGSCGTRSDKAVKDEAEDLGRPSILSVASTSPTWTVTEGSSGSEGDDDFQETNKRKKKQAVEIKYEHEMPVLGTKDAERGQKVPESNECNQPLPKIYFGSRTHKQITQLVKELKSNTVYRPKMVVLGGRNHYCINPKLKDVVDKNDACQELVEAEGCSYKHKADDLLTKMFVDKKGRNRIWDMEDLIRKGDTLGACPYFAARSLTVYAELIFCPYNYLIDPNIRKSMEIELGNAIVILDEAHNIESTARDAGGLEVQYEDLKLASRQFGDMIKHEIHENTCRKLLDLATMFMIILDEQTVFTIKNYEESIQMWSSPDWLKRLNQCGLNEHTIDFYRRACDDMSKALRDKKERQKLKASKMVYRLSEDEQEKTMEVFASPRVMRLLEGILTIMDRLFKCSTDDLDDYKIAIVESVDRGWAQEEVENSDNEKQKRKKTAKNRRQGQDTSKKREILFWCLNPGVIFRPISTRARSVILTSGTLSPLDSFASELQTSFTITLEADHVVDKSHVWAGVIPWGPTKVKLDGTYKSINTFGFQDELGRVIEQVTATTPHGVLCFVSSYTTIDTLVTRWKQTGQFDKLCAIKEVIIEPRRASNKVFDKTLKRFYTIIADEVAKGSNGGALLFAVYRGKCSEGIDFTDSNCRAVLAVSIPFPSLNDQKIKLKKEYNDKRSVRRPMQLQPQPAQPVLAPRPKSLLDIDLQSINHSTGTSSAGVIPSLPAKQYIPPILLSGKRWYEVQAFRAYNQAIGRCIRHRKDWGAMILLDYRLSQPHNFQSLSKWARPLVKSFPVFEDAMRDIKAWIAPLQAASQLEVSSVSSSSPGAGIAKATGSGLFAVRSIIEEARAATKSESSPQTDTGALWVLDLHGDRPNPPDDSASEDGMAREQGSVIHGQEVIEIVSDAQDMGVDEDMEDISWATPLEGSPEPDPHTEFPENKEGMLLIAPEDVSMFSGDDDLDMSQSRQEAQSEEENRGYGNTEVGNILSDFVGLVGPVHTEKTHRGPVDGVGTGSSSSPSSGSGQQQQQHRAPPLFGAPTFQRTSSLSSMISSGQGTLTADTLTANTPIEALPDGSIRILCKTCDEPLLICTSRPNIKTVHKTMAEDMLSNRKRVAAGLSGANPFGTQVAHTNTQVQTQIPTTPIIPGQGRIFQRSNSNMSLTGGESSHSHTSGEVPNAKIWVVPGSSVLQTPFDRQPNAEEYDCIWKPQDNLCYRRIMCPRCGQHELATAKASSYERAISGWRGVIVVITSGGGRGSQDEALERGTAWLTPGEFRCA